MTEAEKQILHNQIYIMDGIKTILFNLDNGGNTEDSLTLRSELYDRTKETTALLVIEPIKEKNHERK